MSTALERWSWLTAEVNGRAVLGMPGVRDPESPCDEFFPGKPSATNTCNGDGHYMCEECSKMLVCGGCGRRDDWCECSDDKQR